MANKLNKTQQQTRSMYAASTTDQTFGKKSFKIKLNVLRSNYFQHSNKIIYNKNTFFLSSKSGY